MVERELLHEGLLGGFRYLVLGHGPTPRHVAGILSFHIREQDLSQRGACPVGADQHIHRLRAPIPRSILKLHLYFPVTPIPHTVHQMPVLITPTPIARRRRRHLAILALDPIEVRPQQVVQQVPARHLLRGVLAVDLVPVLVEIVAQLAGHRDRVPGPVVLAEERLRVPAGDDPGALVVEEGRGVALEYPDGVAEPFEHYAGEETPKASADLGEGDQVLLGCEGDGKLGNCIVDRLFWVV